MLMYQTMKPYIEVSPNNEYRIKGEFESLIFQTNNTYSFTSAPEERLRITKDGNVAVGKPYPAAIADALEVEGIVSANYLLGDGSKLENMTFQRVNNEMAYSGVGSVGVGTTTPTERLEIESTANSDIGLIVRNTNTASSRNVRLKFTNKRVSDGVDTNVSSAASKLDDIVESELVPKKRSSCKADIYDIIEKVKSGGCDICNEGSIKECIRKRKRRRAEMYNENKK